MIASSIVSLFSGYGGLEMGVQQVIGGRTIAHVEFDSAPSRILAHHWPDVPNLGDVTAVDWHAFLGDHPELSDLFGTYRPGLVVVGGFPCQDVSLAGLRRGLRDGTRSGLWSEFARAIDVLRPELVVIENVRGLLSAEADRHMESSPWGVGDRPDGPALRALGAVLGDLAELGYDAEWCGIRAADAGAPHGRYRVFVVAYPAGKPRGVGDRDDVPARGGTRGRGTASGAGLAEDADVAAGDKRWVAAPGQAEGGRARADAGGRGRASAADADRGRHGGPEVARGVGRVDRPDAGEARERERTRPVVVDRGAATWGPYAAAVARWELVTGRPAPEPTNLTDAYLREKDHRRLNRRLPVGHRGPMPKPRRHLAPEFVEWMMGLPEGHVSDVGLNRNEQLKALGNGVVPQQATLAVGHLLARQAVTA